MNTRVSVWKFHKKKQQQQNVQTLKFNEQTSTPDSQNIFNIKITKKKRRKSQKLKTKPTRSKFKTCCRSKKPKILKLTVAAKKKKKLN